MYLLWYMFFAVRSQNVVLKKKDESERTNDLIAHSMIEQRDSIIGGPETAIIL